MSQTKRPRPSFFTINRPPWQEALPRGLRMAAEWQFGTIILFSTIAAIRGDLTALPVGGGVSLLFFLLLSGWAEGKRINSKVAWWAVVIGISLLGAFVSVILIVDPPP